MDDDLVKRLRMTGDNHAADAIERLSAENAALEKDKAALTDQCFDLANKLFTAKHHATTFAARIRELEARIASLESGQPVEHRGEMWQLVRVQRTPRMAEAAKRAAQNIYEIGLGDVDAVESAWFASLTASAQEAQEDKPTITDGFATWECCRPDGCGLEVVRPGKVQCNADDCPTKQGDKT